MEPSCGAAREAGGIGPVGAHEFASPALGPSAVVITGARTGAALGWPGVDARGLRRRARATRARDGSIRWVHLCPVGRFTSCW